MNKAEMIDFISDRLEISKKDSKEVFEYVFIGIIKSLKDEGSFAVPGFGTFRTAKRKGRIGRNPITGELLQIPTRTVVTFKAAKSLKELFNK